VFSESEYREIWDRFYSRFQFKPSVRKEDWPVILEPSPSMLWFYDEKEETRRSLECDLNSKILQMFRFVISPKERLYALNWQHASYWFSPHAFLDSQDPKSWLAPVFPDGDYYIFLSEDFDFGLFGHPWESSLCLFGQKLLDVLEKFKPILFSKVIRMNGKTT